MFEMILLVWLVGVPDPLQRISEDSFPDMAACVAQLEPRLQLVVDAFILDGVPAVRVDLRCRPITPPGELT